MIDPLPIGVINEYVTTCGYMYVYVFVHVCVSIWMYVCISVYVTIYMFVDICVYVCGCFLRCVKEVRPED